MKKNFVKKSLASTLALAMVATAMPGAFTTASAAKAPALNKTSKTLYINDNEIGSSFDFNIKNKVSGSTYKWTTSNKAIATVNSKGVAKAAKKTGEATISCKITLKTKKTKTLKATVTVKENATKVWAKNAPENNTVGIGESVFDFNSSMSSASGAKATDYRMWEIDEASNTAGATIDKKSGVVTTTKAGEFKVRVRAYQNKAKLAANDTVDSEWMTIKVVPAVKSVAQTTTTKVAVTFDDNMKEVVKKADFSIKNKANGVVAPVKDITFDETGKVVTLEAFGSFIDGATYVLTYGEKEFDFSTTIGEVASIEVQTTTVNEGEDTVIKYVLKNANGVDITSEKDATVTMEAVENKNGWFDSSSNKLVIYKKGDTAKIKVTYHTYKYDATGNEVGAVSTEVTIAAVEKTTATIGAYKNYVVASEQPDWTKVTTNQNVISINEQDMELYVNALDSENNAITGLTFKSGNDNVLLVDTDSDNNCAKLVAVNEGNAVVNVYKGDTFLWSLPVVVRAERKASSVALASNSITVSKSFDNTNEIKLTVKDQYNDNFTIAADTMADIVALNPAAKALSAENLAKLVKYNTSKDAVVVNGNGIAEGEYQVAVSLSANANAKAVLTIKVVANAGTATNAIAFLNATTSVDTTISADTDFGTGNKLVVTNKLYEVDSKNVASGAAVTAKVKVTAPNGTVLMEDNTNKTDNTAFTFENGALNFTYATKGDVVEKAATGTYRVDAALTLTDGTVKRTVLYITVEDNQSAPTIKVEDIKATDIAGITSKITVNRTNCTVEALAEGQYTVNGKSVYVKEVTVKETIKTGLVVTHTVKVGQTFTVDSIN